MHNSLIGLVVALALLGACKKSDDGNNPREQAVALAAQYLPEAKAIRLRVIAVQTRAGAIGADAVTAPLAQVGATLDGIEADVGQARTLTDRRALTAAADRIAGALTSVDDLVTNVEREVAVREAAYALTLIDAGVPDGGAADGGVAPAPLDAKP